MCGNLTSIGQQEAFDFGNWLAAEYVMKHGFVSSLDDIYVRSTLKSRTVFTAVGVMAGFLPTNNDPLCYSFLSTT